jgi:hypothetical protein
MQPSPVPLKVVGGVSASLVICEGMRVYTHILANSEKVPATTGVMILHPPLHRLCPTPAKMPPATPSNLLVRIVAGQMVLVILHA